MTNSNIDYGDELDSVGDVKAISTGVKKHDNKRIKVMNSSHI